MAKAPKPGAVREAEQSEALTAALSQVVTLYCKAEDRTLSFSMGDVSSYDDLACRQATGMNTTELIAHDAVGQLEVLAIWWLARRHNGEPTLKITEVLDAYPTLGDFVAAGFDQPKVEDEDETEAAAPEV